ncbi:LuxR C-terminal-related transcriptional regulator [Streptomyces sp. NPDC048419]|uniref:helix-turn-helix transcriptional regulator n=1 Tax=Streptomyces sp. NPDC048419 TaxID=3365547 RepID=UPI0037226623
MARRPAGRPARYCSNKCRQRAFRRRAARQGARAEEPAASTGPFTDPDQATAPTVSSAPTPATTGHRHCLPLPLSLDSFVGRRQELRRLRTLLRSSRLLTLTGTGGVGKTRLALELARRLPSDAGRVDVVELESLHDGALVAQFVAAELAVGESAGRTAIDVVAHAIGDTSRLLILDNCEHLVDPCAHLAAALLSRCPELRILATSREALRVPGEVVFRVSELSLPAPCGNDDPASLLQADAVRLFVDRASACAPGFRLDRRNGRTVAEICRSLDGLTLAVELAARRVGTLPLSDILTGLDDQLSLLADGNRTGPYRHRELAAAIDWSHRMLDPVERQVFRRLSVLVGGFDRATAEAVCAGGGITARQILRVLCALETKSLIVRVSGGATPVRFRQLAAIRAYALERLTASGELHATRQRVLHWLNALAERVGGEAFADQAGGSLAAERDNLAAALAECTEHYGALHARPALELARVQYQQEQPSAARTLLARLLDDPAGQALGGSVPALAARVACQQGELTQALDLGERAVEVERTRKSPTGLANALDARAAARLGRGEFAEAVADLRESLDVVAVLGNAHNTAWCAHHLAWALLQAGSEQEADVLMSCCLPDLRRHASWRQLAAALHTAGAVRLALGDLKGAEKLFAEVLKIVPGASFHALYPVEGLAIVAAESGELQRALRLCEASAQARRRLDTEPEAPWRRRVEETAARARIRLSVAAREAAVNGARRLRGDKLVAYALRESNDRLAGDDAGSAVAGKQFPLTGREFTVADLVSEGLTNRQIAEKLDLSLHTVASHLDKVRDKLGLRSRTQIALWVTDRTTSRPTPAPPDFGRGGRRP